jgi:hypothetical protein
MFIHRYTGFVLKEYLVWDKRHIGMGQGYRKQHEMIVALEKGKPAYNSAGFAKRPFYLSRAHSRAPA